MYMLLVHRALKNSAKLLQVNLNEIPKLCLGYSFTTARLRAKKAL